MNEERFTSESEYAWGVCMRAIEYSFGPCCFFLLGQSFRKAKKEIKEECTGDAKHCRKKNGPLLKKKLSTLSLFSGRSRDVM